MFRQPIDDESDMNPATGLPKHVYNHNHAECLQPAFMGTFQYKGKKYHTKAFHYDADSPSERVQALIACHHAVEQLKDDTSGYREYVSSGAFRKRVRRRSKAIYDNSVRAKNNRSARSSVGDESLSSTGSVTIRHTGSVQ